MIEAMSSGVPVVAVNAGGVKDLVSHGSSGFLARTDDDMKEFTEYVRSLLGEAGREKRAQMGVEGRKWAERWSWETATSILRNIQYQRAIQNHRDRLALAERPQGEDDSWKAEEEAILRKQFDLYRPDLA